MSLWANVPHYLSNTPNPKAMYALVRRVLGVLDHPLDLHDVETAVSDFESKVAEVIANNPAVASYVRQLEERESDEGKIPPRRESELPSSDQLVQELEQFLRQQRRDKPSRIRLPIGCDTEGCAQAEGLYRGQCGASGI